MTDRMTKTLTSPSQYRSTLILRSFWKVYYYWKKT